MSGEREINRRNLVKAAGAAGAFGAIGGRTVESLAADQPPPGFADQKPFASSWTKPLSEIVNIDLQKAAPELADPSAPARVKEAAKERHRIYCYLLMAVVRRFWNGNKLGPVGYYGDRKDQRSPGQPDTAKVFRYRGDDTGARDPFRVNWDRYIGHNIACLAVDSRGEIIDFEFNHNDLFRSSAEHAEARMVRRLFTLTQDFDAWKDRNRVENRTASSRISLDHVTLYTSLESCAQCSGVMSLANIKRVIYLQNDFGAYQIGNIMFNLAEPGVSPLPIPGSAIDLKEFTKLNDANREFGRKLQDAQAKADISGAFFVPAAAKGEDLDAAGAVFSPSITSFLCTDTAYAIFSEGAAKLGNALQFPDEKLPGSSNSLTNSECQAEAMRFLTYADVEGFRGSPHRP